MRGVLRGVWSRQFLKFCVVGVSNTAVSYAINVGVLLLLKNASLEFDYVIANTVSFLLSVLWSYYWNRRFVFGADGDSKLGGSLARTYASYAFTGIGLNNVLSWLWITRLGVPKILAPLPNLVVSVPVNYLLNKYWAFGYRRNNDGK